MNTGTLPRTWGRDFCTALAAGLLLAVASTAEAQLLYSFETDLEGWGPTMFTGSDLIGVTQSTLGPTNGTHSMAVERGNAIGTTNGFSWDVNRTVTTGALPNIYAIFQSVAADPTKYALDFDVTITPESFAEVTETGPFFSINVSVNGSASGENNFNEVDNAVPDSGSPNLIGVDEFEQPAPKLGTHHYSIPLAAAAPGGGSTLYLVPNSTYYQLNIGSNLTNALFINGPNGEGAVYFVDNVRFTRLPVFVPETLFSWETPDNPGTTGVDERYEGWIGGNFGPSNPPHPHAITTTGATHGSYALEIDRSVVVDPDDGFTWGSLFVLSSDTNPDPMIDDIDPVVQARIDEMFIKVEAADRVAFDLTYQFQDLPPAESPTFTNFAVHFSDEFGRFYQKAGPQFNVVAAVDPTTITVEIPLDQFVDANTGTLNLKTDGFVNLNNNFFRIGIATSTDGGQIYQIDNFRLLTAVPAGIPGDYNGDDIVDAADYTIWRDHLGQTFTLDNENPAALTPGVVDAEDYNFWKLHFGEFLAGGGGAAASSVPEPSTLVLAFLATVLSAPVARRLRRS